MIALYLGANAAFIVLLAVGSLLGSADVAHPLYLSMLFALCSSAMLGMRRLNDQQALLGIFSAVFFLFFGVEDVVNLVFGGPGRSDTDSLISPAEVVILVGGALVHVAYRLACNWWQGASGATPRDWSERALVLAGFALWVVCTWLSWEFKVNVVVDSTNEATRRGLSGISGLQAAGFMLAIMLQQLGILILAYAQCRYRRAYMLPVLVMVVLVQLAMGFVVDIKGDALLAAAIVVLVKVLVDGRLPKSWLVAFVAFVVVAFPVLQANRVVRGEYGMDRSRAAQSIGKVLERALATSKKVTRGPDRALTFTQRMSLKGSVEMIVSRTGKDVAFQDGYTLSPIVTAFVPRLIWPTKPDVQAGQIMNREFQVSEVADTYISPSHLGELYWNFGWAGVLIGMPIIGLMLGYLGARLNLAQSVTLTRVMIIVVTIRLMILGSEGTIAVQYVVWLRSMLAIGLLHLLFARVPWAAAMPGRREAAATEPGAARAALPFPNLMR